MMESRFRTSKILRIAAQVLFWAMVFLFPLHLYDVRIMDPQFFKRELVNDLFFLGLFYFNINYLIPRFFVHKKLLKYFLFLLIALIVITAQQISVEKIFSNRYLSNKTFAPPPQNKGRSAFFHARPMIVRPMMRPGGLSDEKFNDTKILGMPEFLFFVIIRKTLTTSLLLLLMGSFLKLSLVWFNSEREKERLQKEKLNTELKFLKSQVNPHFLFNSLNSLYVLAHKKSEDTEGSILKLSQIMRYMIYDSNVDFVPLMKEIEYLHNYVDLQRLRLPEFLAIDFSVEGAPECYKIEPMLLIPFVENAFKHGISYNEKCRIEIFISIKNDFLTLETDNKIFRQKAAKEQQGIGLANVKARLEMLYGYKHQLAILNDGKIFKTKLQLQLNKI